jgi:serine phosphatase RsbU (regulator of sigma subunit)
MTSSPAEPHRESAAPLTGGRWSAVRDALLHSFGGRTFLAGVVLKAINLAARLVVGAEPVLVSVAGTLGSVALIVAAGCLLVRVAPRARRNLLWRVRAQLILSYVFIGVIPALLIVAFFIVSGLVLFLNVASYLVTNGFDNVRNEAIYVARLTATEIQRGPGPGAAEAILSQRESALASIYPGASIALVPTRSGEPCVVGPPAALRAGSVPDIVAAEREAVPETRAGAASRPVAVTPVAVGPWEHGAPPKALPKWISCAGFGGIVVEPALATPGSQPSVTEAPAVVTVRGVGLPDAQRPAYAVIVDIPKNAALDEHLRNETSVKMGDVSVVLTDGLRATLAQSGWTARQLATAPPATTAGATRRLPWVAMLQGTAWDGGLPVQTTAHIEVNIAEIYDRLSSANLGSYNFGSMLLLLLLFVALLFLVIEAAALVMGLTLARAITGSVHELFEGTEHVRKGDFSHRIQVATRDQLGDLAESFNQMTGSIEDLLRQAEEKKRLEEELRIARVIQMSLLPQGQIAMPGVSVSALCVPAREVGGDYYDFFPLGDDRFGMLIADVSGKGTSAALYMAELKGLMLSLSRTCPSPRQLMLTANQIISDHLDSRSFITMAYAVIDLSARTMVYARAGHTPLIYRRESGDGDPSVEVLTPDGLVLGLRIDGGETFERLLTEITIPLHRGDAMLLFTDGISEAMNAESDLFGDDRLARLVGEHGHLPTDELRERILREIDAFVAGAPQHDDMTMILIKFEEFVPGAVAAGFRHD